MKLVVDAIAAATGGRITRRGADRPATGISTDSRTLSPGQLFVALKGPRFDGNAFILDAVRNGAVGLVVETGAPLPLEIGESAAGEGTPFVVAVQDTLRALGDLARERRKLFSGPVVAVTGSNGKTTTKEMLHAVLSSRWRTAKNPGNFNNLVGVPHTIFGLREEHQALVVELGMNHPGEIARLTEIVDPRLGIITSIAAAHIGHLRDLDGVRRAKGELLETMRPEATAFLNGDDEQVASLAPLAKGKVVTFGLAGENAVRAERITSRPQGGVSFTLLHEGVATRVVTRFMGLHNVVNALAAAAAGFELGLSPEDVADGLARCKPLPMRLEEIRLAGIRIINDAYNANPGSVRAAVDTFVTLPVRGERKVLLGDMLELGEFSRGSHRQAGEYMARQGIDLLVSLGKEAEEASAAFGEAAGPGQRSRHAGGPEEAAAILLKTLAPGDALLVKGSRSMALEKIIEEISARLSPPGSRESSRVPPAPRPTRPPARPAGGPAVNRPRGKEDLRGMRVTVVGLAATGIATANCLAAWGARVTISEQRSREEVAQSLLLLHPAVIAETGGHLPESFTGTDLVVPSPGVPKDHPGLLAAVGRGVPVLSEIELAGRLIHRPLLAVTGTNGKSTTVSLLGRMLEEDGRATAVVGNIGTPLISMVDGASGFDALVVEVSSFQLEWVETFHPRSAAVLNVTDDHLDRYRDFEDYLVTKMRIAAAQGPGDSLVLPAGDPLLEGREKGLGARILRFGHAPLHGGVWRQGTTLFTDLAGGTTPLLVVDELPISGVHNQENVMAAAAMALDVGVSPEAVRRAALSYRSLPHRNALVAEVAGVRYFDDSKGTNVGAVEKSLQGFAGNVILIAGGREKGGSYLPLAGAVRDKVKLLVVIGEARERMRRELGSLTRTEEAASMEEAVETAARAALPGDTVLLSPGCSSFDMFRDYHHRGEVFRQAVRRLACPRP
jgi:UDP-N-acetylmuramoylalanine--D-glutamate ligase